MTGWRDGEVERRDASGRLPRDASAQRAPYLRYTFARKTRWTYLARLLRLRPLSSSPPVSFYITTLRISANQINYSHEYNYQPADILLSFRWMIDLVFFRISSSIIGGRLQLSGRDIVAHGICTNNRAKQYYKSFSLFQKTKMFTNFFFLLLICSNMSVSLFSTTIFFQRLM